VTPTDDRVAPHGLVGPIEAWVPAEPSGPITTTPCKTPNCGGRSTKGRGPLAGLCDECGQKQRDRLRVHQTAMRSRDASAYAGQVVRAAERVVSLRWQLQEAEAELDRIVTEHKRDPHGLEDTA
jgi:hypothetical protein